MSPASLGARASLGRIAIVKLSSLGDVIHALPVARALRQALPEAELTWIVEAREYAILRDHPDLDAVLPVDTRLWRRLIRRPAGMRQVWDKVGRLRTRIRRARFDVAIDLQGLLKSGLLTAYTGAPVRIGFSASHCRERWNVLFTNRRVSPPDSATHIVERYLALLEPLGIVTGKPEFRVPIPAQARRRMDDFLGKEGVKPADRLVAINPGAGRPEKQWPVAHFRTLAERLVTEAGARMLLVWGPDEAHMARQIGQELPGGSALTAPPTDLGELTALLARSRLMIANDTGPLHLAAALGTPALGLFGPTRADRNGPFGPRCRGLESPDHTMAGLSPARVFQAAREMLEAPA
jgi:lipopolysaccharide heptosyltransferase I